MRVNINYYYSYFLGIFLLLITPAAVNAQTGVGVNTTTPLSTLDVNGSVGVKSTTISVNTSLDDTYSTVLCNNASDITVTLPLAATCRGRVYTIKRNSTGNIYIATGGTDSIDAVTDSWLIDEVRETVMLVSDGVSTWDVKIQSTPIAKSATKGGAWNQGGNLLTNTKAIGTTSNFDLPLITNGAERARLSAAGSLGVGTSAFDGTNPEKLLVEAGVTNSINVISARGALDSYLQFNVKNTSATASATSDVVATADNGNESVNYVDLGINSSSYNVVTFTITGVLDAYLYSAANNFAIGNATPNKHLKFFTNGTLAANERMRITSTGDVSMGLSAFDATNPEKLLVHAGTTASVNLIKARGSINSYLQLNVQNLSAGANASTNLTATADNGNDTINTVNLGINSSAYSVSRFNIAGANDGYLYSTGNDFAIGNGAANKHVKFFTNGTLAANERLRITNLGRVGIGITAPDQLLHLVKNTATGNVRDDVSIIEENELTGTGTSNLPTLNLIRQIPASGYTLNTLIPTGILSFGTRVPASATLNDMTRITSQTYNATSRIEFLTRTGMTNGDPSGGAIAVNMRIDGTALYVANLTGAATSISCDANGNIIRTPSDRHLKTSIATITNALDKVKRIRGVSYNWIDNKRFGSQDEIGFIAQELAEIVPEVVRTEGAYQSVNYQVITALLAEAIKERQVALVERQKKIEQLKRVNRTITEHHQLLEDKLKLLLKQLPNTTTVADLSVVTK
jgi:hypothetical protein